MPASPGARRKDAVEWTSSDDSASTSSTAAVSKRTIRRQFVVNSPRRKSVRTVVDDTPRTSVRDGSTTPRRRRESNGQLVMSPATPTTPKRMSRKNAGTVGAASSGTSSSTVSSQSQLPARRKSKGRRPYQVLTSWRVLSDTLSLVIYSLRMLLSVALGALGIALSPVQSAITTFVLLSLVLGTAFLALQSPLASLASLLVPSSILSIPALLGSTGFSPISALKGPYCSVIGIGCQPAMYPVARVARTVSDQARQANDIFQSVVALGDPNNLGLHPAEVWELAVAVQATSDLENRDWLGENLRDLGFLTRDVKDKIITVNAQGINSFSWIVNQFTRIEKTIELMQSKPKRYKSADISRQLDALFESLSQDLHALLSEIESAIPLAVRASDLGGRVLFTLGSEHARLNKVQEERPFWRKLKEINSYSSRQLSRDLMLTDESVASLQSTRRNLEDARGFLLTYRDHVQYFKSSAMGYHIADHGLDPEDEVEALKEVMHKFKASVDAAKRGGRGASSRDVPALEEPESMGGGP